MSCALHPAALALTGRDGAHHGCEDLVLLFSSVEGLVALLSLLVLAAAGRQIHIPQVVVLGLACRGRGHHSGLWLRHARLRLGHTIALLVLSGHTLSGQTHKDVQIAISANATMKVAHHVRLRATVSDREYRQNSDENLSHAAVL